MIYSIQNPRYTKASTMIIPLSDGSGTEKYYCPYLKQCNLNLDGLRFAAFEDKDGMLMILSPDGEVLEMNNMPYHPTFGYAQHWRIDQHIGDGYYEKCTSFKHLGRKLKQSDIEKSIATNGDLFNADRMKLIKWELRWQTEGLAVVNGNYHNMKEYQESLGAL